MELDFDKEIDALLRKTHGDGPVFVGDSKTARHLDADEISAFAENAMPEKSRALYTAHLADCDRCRKILSNLLMMNAEAASAAASPAVITIAERELPWFSRLLMFPNLAYVMGSLILVFGGLLAFTIIQNTNMGDSAVVSQMPDAESRQGGPNFQNEPELLASDTAANVAANSNAAVTVNRSTSLPGSDGERGPLAEAEAREERNLSLDGADVSGAAAAPPPAPAAQPVLKDTRLAEVGNAADPKSENKLSNLPVQEKSKSDLVMKQAPGVATQSGPMRNNENQYNRQLENLDRRQAAAKRAARDDEDSSSGRRVVGGRTFERKERVWYDTAYQGRPTINVRRGTAEFNRLDSGLRSIANSLPGTIVVVWGAKAYRIQ